MSLNELAKQINDNATAHGFWESDNFGEMIALMHSELSEAWEEHRSGNPAEYFQIGIFRVRRVTPADSGADGSDWIADLPQYLEAAPTWTGVNPKPEGVAVELADCLIRILDTMHSLGVDIDGVVARKMAYNAARPYKHGKAY